MISPNAVVETDQIGEGVSIGEFCVIRKNVLIRENVTIHPGVIIEENVTIGAGTEIFPWTVIGKRPNGAGAIARDPKFSRVVEIGENCALGPSAVIFYDVGIGANTLVGDGASIRENCRVGDHCIIGRHVTVNYNTVIGNDTKIMDHSWLAGNMSVGSHVFISGGVLTANDNEMGQEGYQEENIIGPQIDDWACIGVGAILLPGIHLGEHAVVGAGAVVTRSVLPYDLVMGIPARKVKRINDDKPAA